MGFPPDGRGAFHRLPPDVVGCLLRGTGSGHDQLGIALEPCYTRLEVSCGSGQRALLDASYPAQHRTAHFRNQLLAGVGFAPEPLRSVETLPRESLGMARRMGQFME